MIEMKKHIVLAALFGVSSLIGWATPFTILFTDGAQMRIHKVEPITDSFESWNKNSNMLKGMFYTYNFHQISLPIKVSFIKMVIQME